MKFSRILDWFLAPAVAAAAVPLRIARKWSMEDMPLTAAVFRWTGYFPILRHYYEPLYDMSDFDLASQPRALPAIDFVHDQQLAMLKRFEAKDMPRGLDQPAANDKQFSYQNRNFGGGDADLLFHMIRWSKPKRLFEIGSGHSTKMARLAIARNNADNPAYTCRHLCIEPFEMPWLEALGVEVLRKPLEGLSLSMFDELSAGDILFIDSSHIIRPGGEVLIEYLQLLPRLKPGVIVHVHDIFTPRDYPVRWLKQPRFWNEQYLLEAFLSHNAAWEILVAANYLAHAAPDEFAVACPYFKQGVHEPGSIYVRRK
jgi:hypothetical protein